MNGMEKPLPEKLTTTEFLIVKELAQKDQELLKKEHI